MSCSVTISLDFSGLNKNPQDLLHLIETVLQIHIVIGHDFVEVGYLELFYTRPTHKPSVTEVLQLSMLTAMHVLMNIYIVNGYRFHLLSLVCTNFNRRM